MTGITKKHLEDVLLNMTLAIGQAIPEETSSQTKVTLKFREGNATAVFDNHETRIEHTVRQRKLNEEVEKRMEQRRKEEDKGKMETTESMKNRIKASIRF